MGPVGNDWKSISVHHTGAGGWNGGRSLKIIVLHQGARNDGLSYYYDDHDENHGYRSFVIGATPIFIKDLPRVKTKAIEK
jgi:hypothetical protein